MIILSLVIGLVTGIDEVSSSVNSPKNWLFRILALVLLLLWSLPSLWKSETPTVLLFSLLIKDQNVVGFSVSEVVKIVRNVVVSVRFLWTAFLKLL